MDVQRYLADEAVQACPPSATYQLKKFLRRNKGPVLAAALVLVALVVGIIGTTWQAVEANRERDEKDKALAAEEAMRAGLVEEVVPSDRFDGRVHELAEGIAAAPPAAVAGIKRSVDSVRPQRNPELAGKAIAEFARTWAAPAHWRAVEKMDKRRRSNKPGP